VVKVSPAEYLNDMKERVDHALLDIVREYRGKAPEILVDAMEYTLTAGGKRFRPILLLTAYSLVKEDWTPALPYAAAVEFVHTYSLIHDDLPAMDDDDFRRGLPTCHVKFGEAVAILTGDALLTEAFVILLGDRGDGIPPERKIRAGFEIATAAGATGMVAGQVLDMKFTGKDVTEDDVRNIHLRKTAALIKGALNAGVILGGGGEELLARISRFGTKLGLAFQIVDDILDKKSSLGEMGKRTGKDEEAGKATYPRAVGIERAEAVARELVNEAKKELSGESRGEELLKAIADFCVERTS